MFTYYNNVREVLEMNVYTTEKIRNVVLLGHSGCGKTSLVEAMHIWQDRPPEWAL